MGKIITTLQNVARDRRPKTIIDEENVILAGFGSQLERGIVPTSSVLPTDTREDWRNGMKNGRWQNQQEAFEFGLSHPSVMLDMDMGTGKTRTALDIVFARKDVRRILVVCPKAVIPVWRTNLEKFHAEDSWECIDPTKGTVRDKQQKIEEWLYKYEYDKKFVIVNYDIVWRDPLGDYIYKKANFDCVILDESHRAKAAGSKVSKYLAMLGKRTPYKMCLSGTPMANSPLDVYGQYRFLDPSIYGTRHDLFLQQYAIMGGAENRFIVGFKNQKELSEKFKSIAYTCKMEDVAERIKLPETLPVRRIDVELSSKDMKISREFAKEFVAECESGMIAASNVLVKMLRLQQITSGFCLTQENPLDEPKPVELNAVKENMLAEILEDVSMVSNVVVFCKFHHDLDAIARTAIKLGRQCFELSGRMNELEKWNRSAGAVLAVQIGAGAEGVDMTKSHYAVYFSLPYSLAQYNQSKARLYRPGQTKPVLFIHLVAKDTVDEAIYNSLVKKKDVIEAIKDGSFDFGYFK